MLNQKNLSALALISLVAQANPNVFEKGRQTILKQTGCYLVDYNFSETNALKAGYVRDERVYDTNADKSTYELIVPMEKSPTEIRLQHVLFLKDHKTGAVQGLMKHNAEDWAFESSHYFDFVSPGSWNAVAGNVKEGWTRKVTNLDDGLRYQCEATWDFSPHHPEWSCANFAPIPGRETRDMGRKDYNTLARKSRLIVYDNSWVERQENVKTIYDAGQKTPLAQEVGRTWYVRQPDSVCAEALAFAKANESYWKVLMEVWEEYLSVKQSFNEVSAVNGMPRFVAMMQIERQYAQRVATTPGLESEVKTKIRSVIEQYRVKP